MAYGHVYLARNKKNGKSYVGQTTQVPEQRFSQHRCRLNNSHCKALGAAIAYYGADAFEFSVICEALSKEELDVAEIAAIVAHNSLAPNGYNIKSGGSFGKHSPETRLRMGDARRGRVLPQSQREKMRVRMLGTSPSPATRAKIAAALKGNKISEANKAALIAANTGRVPSEESRRKMSANRSGIPVSEERKQHLRKVNLGKRHSEETKARMTASHLARWAARKAAAL